MFVSDFNKLAVNIFNNYSHAPKVILIYGVNGIGKTMLLEQLFLKEKNKCKALFINGERFSQYYAASAQQNQLGLFRHKMRTLDLLLFDDLHMLKGKTNTIEELLHTCDGILLSGGKMVFACEGDPHVLNFLGKKLISRIFSGLVLPLKIPTEEELCEFIEYSLRKRLIIMEERAIKELAKTVNSPGEAIEQLAKFFRFAEQRHYDLSFKAYQEYRRADQLAMKREPTPENVITLISEIMGLSKEDLMSRSRAPAILQGRYLAIYTLRDMGKLSFKEIGQFFNLSHGAGINACRKIEEMLVNDKDLRENYNRIRQSLNRR